MIRRLRIRFAVKLALSAAGFLSLTALAAAGIRGFLHSDQDRSPASAEAGSIFEHRGYLSATELGLLGSAPLLRGRHAIFNSVQFQNQVSRAPNQVLLNLFPDTRLIAQIQGPSAFKVNDGLFVGQISGDPESQVRILIRDGAIDGTITYQQSEYRVIDGANGQVVITQSYRPLSQ